MKRILTILTFLFTSITYSQNIAINSTGAIADASALLDIDAAPGNNKGLLIPRIALWATNNATPITSPATSLIVYNTSTASSGATAVYPGYYYWNGTKWVALSGAGSNNWSLSGNAGTTVGTNFLGTTDAVDFALYTNNTEKMRITSAGNIGIGTTVPSSKFSIGSSNQFQINSTGNIIKLNNVTTSFPASQGAASTVLTNDGAGNLSWASNGGGGDWSLTGNSGTSATNNFIGTTDAIDWVVRTNNLERLRVSGAGTSVGSIGINTTSPNRMGLSNGKAITMESTAGSNLELIRITSSAGNQLGTLNFLRVAAANGTITGRAAIVGTTVNGTDATSLAFHTMPAGGSLMPRMTIDDIGNVGIGTTNPAYKLDVAITGTQSASIGGIGTEWGLGMLQSGVLKSSLFYSSSLPALVLKTYAADPIYVQTNGNTRMFISSSGKVGIGTTNPLSPLDISGYLHVSGDCFPIVTSQGAYIGWNALGCGVGETDFINNQGAGPGGFAFMNTPLSGSPLTNLMFISGLGNVGIGTINPTQKLDVAGNLNVCGNISYTSVSAGCSDIRYKKDISPLPNSLDNILKLKGVNYFWKIKDFPEKQFTDSKQIGFIAQEIEKIYPEVVFTDKEGYKSVDYSRITPILVEAIKEQQKIIDRLQSGIDDLKAENQKQEMKIENFNIKYSEQDARINKLEERIGTTARK